MKFRYLFIITCLWVSSLLALEARFQADSLHGSLGDVISFSWDISHASNTLLSVGDYDLEGSGIEVLDQKLKPIKNGTQLKIEAAVYDSVGFFRFPQLLLISDGVSGIDSLILIGPELEITSILSATDTTYRDIKGLHNIRTPFNMFYVLILLGTLVLMYLIFYLFKRFHKSKDSHENIKVIIPPEEAHVIALRALEQLRRSKYLRFDQYKEFHSELTHILKVYYENRFLIDALELTTSELMEKMQSMNEFDDPFVSDTHQILTKADYIKFAKAPSNELESGEALNTAINIVKRSKVQTKQEKTSD